MAMDLQSLVARLNQEEWDRVLSWFVSLSLPQAELDFLRHLPASQRAAYLKRLAETTPAGLQPGDSGLDPDAIDAARAADAAAADAALAALVAELRSEEASQTLEAQRYTDLREAQETGGVEQWIAAQRMQPGIAVQLTTEIARQIDHYIWERVGPLPWVRQTLPGKVLSIDGDRCTVSIPSLSPRPIEQVQYGLNKPQVGQTYPVHFGVDRGPEGAEPLQAHAFGDPWLKVPGGKRLYYNVSTGPTALKSTVYWVDWPLPAEPQPRLTRATLAGTCIFTSNRQFHGRAEFIGVDGNGWLWWSMYEGEWTFSLAEGSRRVANAQVAYLPPGKTTPTRSTTPPNTIPVAVEATPGKTGLLSVGFEVPAIRPRTATRTVNSAFSTDAAVCGALPNAGCTPIYGGAVAPDGFSHRCRGIPPFDPPQHYYVYSHHDRGTTGEGSTQVVNATDPFFALVDDHIPYHLGTVTVSEATASITWSALGRIPLQGNWLVRTWYLSGVGGMEIYASDDFAAFPGDEAAAKSLFSIVASTCQYRPDPLIWTGATLNSADDTQWFNRRLQSQGLIQTSTEYWEYHAYRRWLREDTPVVRVGVAHMLDPQNPGGPRKSIRLADRYAGGAWARGFAVRDFEHEAGHVPGAGTGGETVKAGNSPPGYVHHIWGHFPRPDGSVFAIATMLPSHSAAALRGEETLRTYYSNGDTNGAWSPFPKGGQFTFGRLIASSQDGMDLLVETYVPPTGGPIGGEWVETWMAAPLSIGEHGQLWQTQDGGDTWQRVAGGWDGLPVGPDAAGEPLNGFIVTL